MYRWRFPVRLVLAGLALQLALALALLLLKIPGSRLVFDGINDGVLVLRDATRAGTAFVCCSSGPT